MLAAPVAMAEEHINVIPPKRELSPIIRGPHVATKDKACFILENLDTRHSTQPTRVGTQVRLFSKRGVNDKEQPAQRAVTRRTDGQPVSVQRRHLPDNAAR
jgi:hypothetical protein